METVVIVEDEQSILDTIRMNLELEGYRIIEYQRGDAVLNELDKVVQSDLILLDVMLPGASGIEIAKQIRNISEVPILFLSAKGTTADKIAGLKSGGTDYLAKPFDLEELLLRVQILIGRHSKSDTEESLKIGHLKVNFKTYELVDQNNGAIHTLSKKEIDLLKLFAEKEGEVVSRDEILDRVWGTNQFPTSRTIDNFILAFRKLFEEDTKSPKYFHSVRGVGYRFTNS